MIKHKKKILIFFISLKESNRPKSYLNVIFLGLDVATESDSAILRFHAGGFILWVRTPLVRTVGPL